MLKLLFISWRYAESARWQMVLFYALAILGNVTVAVQPVLLDYLIEALASADKHVLLKEGLLWCGAQTLLILVFWFFFGTSRLIERRLAFVIYRRFVNALYRKVTELPLSWHQRHHSGNTIDRVSKAGKAVFDFSQEQYINIQIGARYVSCVAFLAWYCWWVALLVSCLCALIFVAVRKMDRHVMSLVKKTNERQHFLSAAIYDYVGNIISVLTLRLQGRTLSEIGARFGAMREPFLKEVFFNERKWFVMNMSTNMMLVLVIGLYIVVELRQGKTLAPGAVAAIFQYHLMINAVFFQLAVQMNHLLHQAVDMSAIEELEADHRALGVPAPPPEAMAWEEFDVQGLYFRHEDTQDRLHHLEDVSLSVRRGQKIALVGASGAGKSTLLTLLRGLYKAPRVVLMLDGKAFSDLEPLSAFTTLVPQDTEIFEETIDYNVTMGVEVSSEEKQKILYVADFESVVRELPKGLATDIRERGVNLSGGQKQRLALARGLLAARDSSLLLLDEPTSNVDLATEARIFDRLFTLYADKTIVASVHRLNLLTRFDWVLLMQEGKIVQQGTFEALRGARGPFRDLWKHYQATGEKEENEFLP